VTSFYVTLDSFLIFISGIELTPRLVLYIYFPTEYHKINADDFKLKLHVLDPDFLTEGIAYNNQAMPISMPEISDTLSDFTFSSARKPYLRALAVHAQKSLTWAKEKGWVVDEGSTVAFRQRAIGLARLSVEPPQIAMLFSAL
jgi:hypothetical protein